MRTNKTMNCSVQKEKFNPIQYGRGGGGELGWGKKAPYQFFPCNFYKRRNWAPKRSDS